MRAKDFIIEAFNQPYAFNWQRGEHGDYDIFVKLPDGSPLNIAFNHEGDNVWHVAFDRGHSQDITGEGDAQRIFATVLTSIQQFIIKQDPDRLYFSASKDVEHGQNPESRARLYERMVHRYAAAMGYDVVVDDRRGHAMFILDKEQGLAEQSTHEDRHPNDTPYGPETKPTMPKGTVRVDVSDLYDWYKLGMHISDLDGLGKHDFGKGPPSTIFSFGDEETEHKYIKDLEKTGLTTTDIDPKDPNQPKGMPRQKTDPTFNVNEEEFNGIDITMDVEGDEIMVTATGNGRELGHVLFVDEGEYLMPQDLEVDERFQGQGIAAAMYDYVKSKGYKIRRSGQQTDAGAGFWGKHRPEQNVWENFADGKNPEMNFEEGDCPIFAIALHRLSKLPLMALVEYDDKIGSAVLIHAYVKLNDNWRIDATGETDVEWMLNKYPNNGDAEEIEISERDLIRLGYGKNKCPTLQQVLPHAKEILQGIKLNENFADGRVKGKSRPGRVKRAGASCSGSVTDLRARAKNASGEKAKMYHWCANMKSGRNK